MIHRLDKVTNAQRFNCATAHSSTRGEALVEDDELGGRACAAGVERAEAAHLDSVLRLGSGPRRDDAALDASGSQPGGGVADEAVEVGGENHGAVDGRDDAGGGVSLAASRAELEQHAAVARREGRLDLRDELRLVGSEAHFILR